MKLNTVICGNLEVFQFPVTQKEYKKVVGINPSYHNKEIMGFSTKRFPVTNVSAYDAEQFCELLGGDWRLPSDQEWSLLAGNKKYSGGDDADEVAVYNQENPCEVGTKKPNELGLYDMSGLVWEWTSTVSGSNQVVRGGGWYDVAANVCASVRDINSPDGSDIYLGFRPVRNLKEGK